MAGFFFLFFLLCITMHDHSIRFLQKATFELNTIKFFTFLDNVDKDTCSQNEPNVKA